MRSMRGRLMAYSKGMPAGKLLREKFQHVSSLVEVEEIARQSEWMSVIANGLYQELPEPQYTAEREHAS